MELRVLGLRTERSNGPAIPTLAICGTSWRSRRRLAALGAHTGDLGDWATVGSPYDEDYEEDPESDGDDDVVAESRRVLEYFDHVLDRSTDGRTQSARSTSSD